MEINGKIKYHTLQLSSYHPFHHLPRSTVKAPRQPPQYQTILPLITPTRIRTRKKVRNHLPLPPSIYPLYTHTIYTTIYSYNSPPFSSVHRPAPLYIPRHCLPTDIFSFGSYWRYVVFALDRARAPTAVGRLALSKQPSPLIKPRISRAPLCACVCNAAALFPGFGETRLIPMWGCGKVETDIPWVSVCSMGEIFEGERGKLCRRSGL